jgi:hypothetical protein
MKSLTSLHIIMRTSVVSIFIGVAFGAPQSLPQPVKLQLLPEQSQVPPPAGLTLNGLQGSTLTFGFDGATLKGPAGSAHLGLDGAFIQNGLGTLST